MAAGRRLLGLVAALVAAALAVAVAPEAWSAGEGELLLVYEGETVAGVTVEVGSADPVNLTVATDGPTIRVLLPDGVPTADPVRGTVRVTVDDEPLRPDLEDLALTLELPDGRLEPIPLLSWDAEEAVLVASRFPPVRAPTALALLAAAVVLWVTAVVPLFATAIAIPVVLTVSGIVGATEALAPFFHPIIALFFAGFLLAEAMRRVGLDRWAAGKLVGVGGRGPVGLFAVLMGTAAFLSMWMSNTAAVAVLIPIALAVAAPVGHPGFSKVVVLGTAYAATLGGVGSAIGTPANMLAIEFLETFEVRDITFARWFAYGLPMVVLFLPVIGVWLWRRYRVEVDPAALDEMQRVARTQAREVGFGADQTRVLAVFVLVAVTWLLEGWHGVHPGIVAIGGAVVLALTRDVREEDLGNLNWTALLTFGGGLTLGLALVETGVADWVAGRLSTLGTLPDLLAVAVVATVTLALTTVASNTASAATLIPLAIPLAGLLGVDVTLLVLVVAIASSIDFALIIGTPPTMLAYSTGLFRPAEILRAGAVLDVAGLVVLLVAVTAVWQALGLL